jgi:phosphomannomutase
MERLRISPPTAIAGIPVSARADLQSGRRIDLESGEETTVAFPSSNVLLFHLKDGSRILARPSGTEPKIKYYFEVVERIPPEEKLSAATGRAQERLDQLMDAFAEEVAG